MSVDGLIAVASRHGPNETLERLETAVTRRGMTVVARVDHGAAGERVGMALRRTVVVLFGNPRAGTPLMQAAQTIAIDLPLKALVWQDEKDQAWLGYNDPAWLVRRHGIADAGTVDLMKEALAAVAREATG